MDVGELLSYKPQMGMKHGLDDEEEEEKDSRKNSFLSSAGSGNARKKSRLTGLQRPSLSNSRSAMVPPTPPRSRIPPPTPPRYIPPPTPPRGMSHPYPQPPAQMKARQDDAVREPPVADTAADADSALRALEEQTTEQDEGPMDEARLKKLILSFDKKMLRNQELRIKFPDDPRKFMESELELHDAIEELHALSVSPHLYPALMPLAVPHSLLALVGHDNTDIAAAVLDLLQEMTTLEGVEVSEEEEEGLETLVEGLISEDVVAILVQNLHRLDDQGVAGANALTASSTTPEAQATHNTLGLLENLLECRPSLCSVASSSGLLAWLLKRLRAKLVFDPNKLYASEILAICVQGSEANKQQLGEIEGIDVLLQQLAVYKRHDPSTAEEQELMENLFDVLCSCLLQAPNRELFLKGEGLQLMNLMLREKKLSRNGALRVLDHALTGPEGADCCNKFVDILGLRTIFPLFIKTPSKHGKKGLSKTEHEGHVVSIIYWLLRNCRSNQKQRLMAKFLENDHEKVDRLMELHFSYLERVMATDRQLEKLQDKQEEKLSEDDMYLRRLDGGLFTLQLLDYIMLGVCALGPPSIKRRVVKMLNLRNASVKTIKNIVREYVSNLGDGGGISNADDELSEEQHRVLDWLDKFQNM